MPAKLDQHFLVDQGAASRIVSAAAIEPGDDVVEIGPGGGVLTRRLLRAGAKVTAVELDPKLAAALTAELGGSNLKVLHADWLKLDLALLPSPAKVVSNLPYSVATPILQRLLDQPTWPVAVLMFQKEVAQRILAEPGSKSYGVLSLSVRIKADAELLFVLPPGSFQPPPKVESAVVLFHRRKNPLVPADVTEAEFFRVVKTAFAQRRKMAAKNLASSLGRNRKEVEGYFVRCGLRVDARAETIGLGDYISLTRLLHGKSS